MQESPTENPQKRTIKPGRWIFRAALVVLFLVVGVFGYRVYRFYAAVNAVRQYGEVDGSQPEWLDGLADYLGDSRLFFSQEIVVLLPDLLQNGPSVNDHKLQTLIPHLRQFDGLFAVVLDGTQISEEGISYLVEFNQLSIFYMSEADISDQGLQYISQLDNLERLSLSDCTITDEGIRHLQNLKNLEDLRLDGTDITDDGVRHLQSLKKLESLTLDGTEVTDEGLIHLKSLKNLKHLSLSNTGVTDSGCAELVKAIPGLEILDD